MNKYMEEALKEAKKAYNLGDVPVGAVIIYNDKIIARAHNKKNIDNVSIYHAEILAIIDACKFLGTWRLNECEMFVTLEPCEMCKCAIAESRIKKVSYIKENKYKNNLIVNKAKIKYNKINQAYGYDKILSSFFEKMR